MLVRFRSSNSPSSVKWRNSSSGFTVGDRFLRPSKDEPQFQPQSSSKTLIQDHIPNATFNVYAFRLGLE